MTRKMLCSVLLALAALVCQARVYDVKDFGAKGDGKTLDHVAINKAVETATSEGGGQVVVPASMKAYDESESFGGFPEHKNRENIL